MYWPGDVLYLLLAHILEGKLEFVLHLIVHDPADANPAGLGQGFESSRNIDAVAWSFAFVGQRSLRDIQTFEGSDRPLPWNDELPWNCGKPE